MKKIYSSILCCMTVLCHQGWAGTLTELNDRDLQSVNGQAGVDLSLTLSLNQDSQYKFDTSVCKLNGLEYCRLALSFNNRYDDGSNDSYNASGVRVPSATGKQQWLVFKGIQGTVIIDKLSLDGADVTFKNKTTGNDTYRGALNFGFDPNRPIKIRNFGYQSLSIETDSSTATDVANVAGYLNKAQYTSTTSAFDAYNPDTGVGREKGFLGVNMNGNLSMTGSVKIFSCVDHARC
ncbi:hypothetical protein [Acinetobacter sp. WZC-1]|uniref:hypothetical protein n=1 Tax=Acinetobacter sp. WZC-1 TaxID=3459034 RepID=UPI00403DB365